MSEHKFRVGQADDRMECARGVKRRAAHRHPDVILAGRLPQSFHQAGLAEPGLPLDQHDLAATAATAFPSSSMTR
jgi:hypothetical protein